MPRKPVTERSLGNSTQPKQKQLPQAAATHSPTAPSQPRVPDPTEAARGNPSPDLTTRRAHKGTGSVASAPSITAHSSPAPEGWEHLAEQLHKTHLDITTSLQSTLIVLAGRLQKDIQIQALLRCLEGWDTCKSLNGQQLSAGVLSAPQAQALAQHYLRGSTDSVQLLTARAASLNQEAIQWIRSLALQTMQAREFVLGCLSIAGTSYHRALQTCQQELERARLRNLIIQTSTVMSPKEPLEDTKQTPPTAFQEARIQYAVSRTCLDLTHTVNAALHAVLRLALDRMKTDLDDWLCQSFALAHPITRAQACEVLVQTLEAVYDEVLADYRQFVSQTQNIERLCEATKQALTQMAKLRATTTVVPLPPQEEGFDV